ncbi:transducin beta-like protein 3 [Ischnura elegans]|uniref:transducin beta-like protein 3 n=1 Tax=Ischnura elegans TaxID=197161 RepID=UPI001ED88AEF|nr:transducin beta-like protein 3 [Ischnura elegans]
MSVSARCKEAYDVQERHGAFFTGGQVEWTNDGKHLLCQCDDKVHAVNVETGKVVKVLGNSSEEESVEGQINTFTLSKSNEFVVTAHKTGLFRLWRWQDEAVLKMWKSVHKGPVARLAFGPTDSILASGGTDGLVRVWDVDHRSCTQSLRGLKGVVSVLKFHPRVEEGLIFGADDAMIIAWQFNLNRIVFTLKGHFSTITALEFDLENNYLISSGRDKVLIIWDLKNNGAVVRTVPTFESIEGMIIIPKAAELPFLQHKDLGSSLCVATAGENGIIRIWQVEKGREVFIQKNSLVNKAKEEGGLAITHLLFNAEESVFAVVSADHNIIIHDLHSLECKKQFVGFSDEVLDVVFLGKSETHLAVATNSTDIKVYNVSNFGCQLLKGHTDLVLTLSVAQSDPSLLASGGKDNSVRLWKLNLESGLVCALAVGSLHSASVGTVAFSCISASFLTSASEDTCLKIWKVPSAKNESLMEVPTNLSASHTVIAHQKDINGVCVAPNDKLIASASQDKTIKLWSSENLELVGVLRGHRRGVWTVRFSPVDQVLASASADATIKIWLLKDLTCWKTLEGHTASVLRLEFISRGVQLLTSGGDGLLKLWTVKSGECTSSWDAHNGRIWALAVSKNEKLLVSGGSDSALVVWQDVTEEKRTEAVKLRDAMVEKEQKLSNLMQADDLLPALSLALSLDRPLQVLNIVREIMKKGGQRNLSDTVKHLPLNERQSLLKCASVWNSNSKNCYPAQLVVSALLDELSVDDGEMKASTLSTTIEELIPYTERHFQRLTQMLQDFHLLQYTASQMKLTS